MRLLLTHLLLLLLALPLATVIGQQQDDSATMRVTFTPLRPPVHPVNPVIDLQAPAPQPENYDDTECADEKVECVRWAKEGECDQNPSYMRRLCRVSCGECTLPAGAPRVVEWATGCRDLSPMCSRWAQCGECERNSEFMRAQCRVSCSVCSSDTCHDKGAECAVRARDDGCFADPWVVRECPFSCRACSAKSDAKCARDPSAKPVTPKPGDIGKLFGRALRARGFRGRALSSDPFVLAFDDFVSDAEAEALLAAAWKANPEWERSKAGEGELPVRTSSSIWCRKECRRDKTVLAVQERLASLTGVPASHGEPMQILRYEQGQLYRPHHDQNSPRASPWGPRVFTAYIYLSEPEEGGETRFPQLDLTISPKKGRLLLWANTQDADPYAVEERNMHEAVAPTKGTKVGLIYWLHMWPFAEKAKMGCDNDIYLENWS